MEEQCKTTTIKLGVKVNLIVSILLLFLVFSGYFSPRYKDPVRILYNIYSELPEASYEAHNLMYDYLDTNTYNEMVKTILLNHSFYEGYNMFVKNRRVINNQELSKILRLTKEFYDVLDTNITWNSYPFHLKNPKTSIKLIKEWQRWDDAQ